MAEQTIVVYKKFYSDLLEADLLTDGLIKELQGINLFTDHHKNELEACDTQRARIQFVLDHIVEPDLKGGKTKLFDILLKVMEISNDTDLIVLAKEMKIMYNSVPNLPVESGDEPDLTTEDTAADEVDGRVKDKLTAMFKRKRHDQEDTAATSHEIPSSTARRNYNSIKHELKIIKKYGPVSRHSLPLGSPWLLAKDSDDKLYVRDYITHQVVVFDNKLKYSHYIGNRGEFKSIGGIAVNNETQHVYVADQLLNVVKKFTLDGQLVAKIGCKGIADGEFRSPCGLQLSATRSLYICDSGNHRIQVFHHNDKFEFGFGQRGVDPGCFERPEALAINSIEDKLFISSDNRVQVFTMSGQFLKLFDHFRSASHQLVTPVGLCCTPDSHILISSYGTHCVYVLKEDGTHVSVIKGSHQGKERFVFPAGVIVRDNGNIVIASSGNHQLVVF